MSPVVTTSQKSGAHPSGLSFAKRLYLPRVVGLGIGSFCVAGVFISQDTPIYLWIMLVLYCFIWPHIAYQNAIRSRTPFQAEMRNLLFDALSGGAWIALIGMNILPSVIIIAMMGMNCTAAGGRSLLLKFFAMVAIGCAFTLLVSGRPPNLVTSQAQLLYCLPILIIYPFLFGCITYHTVHHLAEHKQRLLTLSIHDGLTGVYNRLHWEHQLHNEFDSCMRYQHTATLVLVDIDHFKSINDTFGHDVGDEAIQLMTNELRIDLRAIDIIGRYGGDEFGIILPNTGATQALRITNRIRNKLTQLRLVHAPNLVIHISAGIAEYDPQMDSYHQWLKSADIALYKAKKNGRGRTEIAEQQQRRA